MRENNKKKNTHTAELRMKELKMQSFSFFVPVKWVQKIELISMLLSIQRFLYDVHEPSSDCLIFNNLHSSRVVWALDVQFIRWHESWLNQRVLEAQCMLPNDQMYTKKYIEGCSSDSAKLPLIDSHCYHIPQRSHRELRPWFSTIFKKFLAGFPSLLKRFLFVSKFSNRDWRMPF